MVVVDLADGASMNFRDVCGLMAVQWSPDGTEVAYTISSGPGGSREESGLYVLDVDSGQSRRLTQPYLNDSYFHNDTAVAWLTDGTALVVSRTCRDCDAWRYQWLLVPAQGGSEQLIVETGWLKFGGFAPDSQRYLYSDDAVRVASLAGEESALTQPDPSSGFGGLTWSPDGNWVTYAGPGSNFTPLRYTVDIENADVERRSLPDYFELSPTGGEVAFTRLAEPVTPLRRQLWVAAVDGGDERLLVTSDVSSFKWSADGKEIAYTTDDDPFMLRVVDVETAESRDIADLAGERWLSSWSPDGTLLTVKGATGDLELVDAATGQITPVAVGLGFGHELAWSPDTSQLAYERDGSIAVYDLATEVSDLLADGSMPSWSPDGDGIAFWRDVSGYPNPPIHSLIVLDVASGQESELARFAVGAVRTPSWSPDGAQIAVIIGRSYAPAGIYLARADGSDLTHIANLGGSRSYRDLRWSADGQEVSFTSLYAGL